MANSSRRGSPDAPPAEGDTYSEEETIRRREAALKRLLNTPPQPRTKKEPGERAKRGRPKKSD